MYKWTIALVFISFCLSINANAQTSSPIQGIENPERQLPSKTQEQVFQKKSKINHSKNLNDDEVDNSTSLSEEKDSEQSEPEGQSVVTTLGILSTVFPFNTSTTASPNQTFLRLINPESFSNQITVDVYSINFASEFVYEGSCSISVPGKSAPQLDNDYFEDCIGWTPTSSQNLMFLQFDAGEYLYWQNVIWSPTTGYFGNLSTCREPTVSDQFAHSIHTTRISGYPSTLYGLIDVFENYYVDINIYDAGDGDLIGQYRSQLFPQNTVLLELEIFNLEQSATWYIPFANRPFQVNLEFNLVNQFGVSITQGLADLVSHYVQQTATGETYNMLNTCLY